MTNSETLTASGVGATLVETECTVESVACATVVIGQIEGELNSTVARIPAGIALGPSRQSTYFSVRVLSGDYVGTNGRIVVGRWLTN
ncbi:hypothetical protein ACH9L7_10675 [Haloferax sp. S1W]|uniref:hypothetical protein n=1 Tax=Haloferax sp. S1W TaxID=3377110 RepID=UPI0037C53735